VSGITFHPGEEDKLDDDDDEDEDKEEEGNADADVDSPIDIELIEGHPLVIFRRKTQEGEMLDFRKTFLSLSGCSSFVFLSPTPNTN